MVSDFFLLFLQASLTCMLSGALVWALLHAAARFWPAVALGRRVWLLAQLAVAVSFAAVLMPGSAGFSLLPAIELHDAPPASVSAESGRTVGTNQNDVHADDAHEAADTAAPDDADGGFASGLLMAGQTWLAVYLCGLFATAARWLRVRRLLSALLKASYALDARMLRLHPGFAREDSAALLDKGLRIRETSAPISPMLLGCFQPMLLLPEHLRGMDPGQQELIVAHELTHWRSRDQLCLHLSLALQTLFWFNPVFSRLREKLALAQELACDRRVLAGRPPAQHKNYAAALLGQLKVQQQSMQTSQYASLAFGGDGLAALGMRIRLIRQPLVARLNWVGRVSLTASVCALLGASILLQPAFAWRGEEPGRTDAAISAAAATAAEASSAVGGVSGKAQWLKPMRDGRVSSFFGVPRKSSASIHHGVDFAAKTGTEVRAVADGVVAESTDLYAGQEKYGKVVVIEHADGLRSLYAHLDSRSVLPGDSVKAGQLIARSGASGRVSGPHLHLEALKNGQHIDPQTLIGNLEQGAFKSALRKRAAAHLPPSGSPATSS
ncbi:M23/M56 family metallopeptidase [Pseudoduganella violacea]|uniref:Murein DD-endopeptidase MepM/ murein hydrolase activator NlpD n=1 Tax=Pseudoduganella violacea TaxID=1715466 RepID=A0A7W5FUQ9_9BURK|nr:M23/M56 family metallopeptidase [Pseudoduganella violacea]MBB3120034.1 murein DD-endopeptidase MepM/ murein hydrolase activator NlpD [Pseudoduganella violacea]